MLREAKKLKESTLEALEKLPKHERQVMIGKLMLEDPSVKDIVNNGVLYARRRLFWSNSIQSDEVLSIKNDAVFIIGRKLPKRTFGAIEFREKNVYACYLLVEGIEFYYDKANSRVDVKGVRDEIVEHPDHQAGMITFFKTVMGYLVQDRRDALRKYLIEFVDAYKKRQLPAVYYREFSHENIYRSNMNLEDFTINFTEISEENKKEININYNYMKYVLPVVRKFI